MSDQPVFYYDLGSPYAYLAAERIGRVLPVPARWQPILLGGLFKRFATGSWARGPGRAAGIAEVERRAAVYGLPPPRWPDPWPGDGLLVMRVATCGLTPAEALAEASSDPVKRALREATDRAAEQGVHGVPTVVIDGRLFFGDDHLDEAATALR